MGKEGGLGHIQEGKVDREDHIADGLGLEGDRPEEANAYFV